MAYKALYGSVPIYLCFFLLYQLSSSLQPSLTDLLSVLNMLLSTTGTLYLLAPQPVCSILHLITS